MSPPWDFSSATAAPVQLDIANAKCPNADVSRERQITCEKIPER
ncbi:MAG: hypothetical protein RLZZ232_3446 [Planctomycetota bacterium]|jgi:hypothetical protein